MVKMLTACTEEIDDVEEAVAELLKQLDLENNLLEHSVGLIFTYSEFVETGVVKAICDALPFDVVGCTTISNGVPGSAGMMLLSISVLTSNDVSFTVAETGSISIENFKTIQETYEVVTASFSEKPKMVLPFIPITVNLGGEIILEKIVEAVGEGIPIFGTLAVDHFLDFKTSGTIINGEFSQDKVVMVLFSGNFNPRFIVAAISDKQIQEQRAVITRSKDNILQEVNGSLVIKYMESLGLSQGNGIDGMPSIPFLVDSHDGSGALARAMYTVTPEGYVICGAKMPVGATLAIGSLDDSDVLKTTEKAITALKKEQDIQGVLIYPCLSRYMAQGVECLREINIINKILGTIPYQIGYAGGEICPVKGEQEKLLNRFHNFSLIACAF